MGFELKGMRGPEIPRTLIVFMHRPVPRHMSRVSVGGSSAFRFPRSGLTIRQSVGPHRTISGVERECRAPQRHGEVAAKYPGSHEVRGDISVVVVDSSAGQTD